MKDTSDMAYPCPETEKNYYQSGMSLRDYFAGQALPAILKNNTYLTMTCIDLRGKRTEEDQTPFIARKAYLMADAMLEERDK